jgi:TatD DNase family protein
MLVDSHCHLDQLDLSQYEGSLGAALQAAQKRGVERFLCVCIDLDHFPDICSIAENHPEVKISLGLHPTEKMEKEPTLKELSELAQHPSVVAIGETGLDYYRCHGDISWQQERFRRHIAVAKILKKPLIIHTREAQADTIQILIEENAADVGGVMHCFTETWEMAEQALDLGFYISFSGIITFKNAKALQEVVRKTPLERLLIETDAPYLAPVPYRGKPNQPAYVREVAEWVAELKGMSFNQIAEQTTQNFFRLFRDFK